MRILTSAEVRRAGQQALERPGISALVLMQRAGYAVAQFCIAHFKFSSVCVVCGKGENGGRGLVAAQALLGVAEQVFVIILAKDASELSPDAATICSQADIDPIWIADEAAFEAGPVQDSLAADLIIDAIASADFQPPLQGLAAKAVAAINAASGTVVSVDLPSGVDGDRTTPIHESSDDLVYAHGIVGFIAPRPAHVFAGLTSGPVAVSEIGVQPALVSNMTGLEATTGQEVGTTFPPRPENAHKGLFGHALVIAGSLGKAGAAGLAGMAALRTGAGLVTVACPRTIQATVAGFAPELMTEGLPETEDGTISLKALESARALTIGKDVIVLGPGLSQSQETSEFVREFVAGCPLPLVLDADGLNAFDGHFSELKPRSETAPFRVLTPHPGEASRLIGVSIKDIQADRVKTAQRISAESGSCVVLKGWRTVVAGHSGETWINMSGNPALAKGGSGDVLSGMIGAALARHAGTHANQRPAAQSSAYLDDLHVAAAVYLHGLTADFARDIFHENTVLATDLLDELAEAFRDCESQKDRGLFYLHR
jgi:hydroxyethylthiazole kinase-like uncharacterized protein yjeF